MLLEMGGIEVAYKLFNLFPLVAANDDSHLR